MNYVKYSRSFVMLEEQNGLFAARSAAPVKGYLKVETGNNKGALRCVVQNLKYYEKADYKYKLILFGKKGERTIHTVIGDLMVNRQGNGETYFRFLPLDVDGKGNAFHNFTTAIVAAASTKDDREPLHPVLKGATASEDAPFQAEPGDLTAIMAEDEEPLFEETRSETRPLPEEIPMAAAATAPSAVSPAADPISVSPAVPKEETPEITSKKCYNCFYNEYVLNACAHTCRGAEFYEDVVPFDKDKTGARWKKIVNIASLPLVSPGAHYFATQYRHYIFGAKPDENGTAAVFYFGIPGRFLDEEQPDGGRSGFTYWQPIKGVEPVSENIRKGGFASRNAYGYWIVAVDGKTGNIEEV
jgi:hypothetical protein